MADNQPLGFGRFEIRPLERQLLVDGQAATVGSRAFDLLLALAERPGQLLAKNALLDIVWPGVFVEENNLQVQISTLRKCLGADVIATIPGRGYRFTALPTPTDAGASPPAPSPLPLPAGASATPTLKTNLPERLPALVGRDDDLATLGALLEGHALITLVGPGGIGKTLLAQHLLHAQRGRHAHGVCFVELASLADARQVAGAVAAALDVRGGADEAGALDGLVQAIAPLSLLLVLDNAEHLLDDVARMARALHAGAPNLKLVITSQAPLQIDAERVYRVGALAWPEPGMALAADAALGYGAVALFAERAQRVDRGFTLDAGNVGAVVAICRRLDGLPLAIGLAAARVPLLGVDGLAAALDERLKLLTTGARDASARHRTLRAALEWSCGLLDAREQTLFRRLGIVVGSASLELVRRIAADAEFDEWSVLDALGVLVERSLVTLDGGSDDAAPRYRLLESPRAYALERLAAAGEEEALRQRHAAAVAARFVLAFEQYYQGVRGADEWQREIEPDLDNARAAFAWGCTHDVGIAAAVAPGLLVALLADPVAHRAVCDAIEPLLDERVPALLRARVWLEGSRVLPHGRAVEWATRSAALYRAVDDSTGRYLALGLLAWMLAMVGDTPAAGAAVAELDSLPAPGVPMQSARGELARAGLAIAQARWDDTVRHFRNCVALFEAAGSSDVIGSLNVIEAEFLAGDVDAAVRDAEQLVARLRGTRWASRLAMAQVQLIAGWLAKDRLAEAHALVAEVLPQAPAFALEAMLADHAALLAALQGRPHAAAQLLGHADTAYTAQRETRQAFETQSVERALALARSALGDTEADRLRAIGTGMGREATARAALGESDLPG